MSESSDFDGWSSEWFTRIRDVSEPFDIAWKEGKRPRIEDAFRNVEEPEWSAFFVQLLKIELDYRFG